MVRRGDKDNHFVGYTYKRKPTATTRPSVANATAGRPEIGLKIPAATSNVEGGGGAASVAAGAAGGAAAVAGMNGKKTPTSGKSSPTSGKSTPRSASRKSAGKGTLAGLFGGKKLT